MGGLRDHQRGPPRVLGVVQVRETGERVPTRQARRQGQQGRRRVARIAMLTFSCISSDTNLDA